MDTLQHLQEIVGSYMPLIIILIIWDVIWKLIAMWKAGRNNQLVWFICLAVINTLGILPIVYIFKNRNN